ncbi:cytochrome P450 [Mucidula mucida]|nr:cytochrome P450 [Mucidula mucida]
MLLALALLFVAFIVLKQLSKSPKLPPGPRSLPIIGNALQLWTSRLPMEETFTRWASQFGDVMLVTLPGGPMIVLNTLKATKDLLDKRGSIYSDRPRMVLHMEMRIIMRTFNPKSLQMYSQMQEDGAHRLVRSLSNCGSEFSNHFSQYVASTVIRLTYGEQNSDHFLSIAHESMESTNSLGIPSTTLPDLFPVLKHVPVWMPFAGFRRHAEKVRKVVRKAHDIPFNSVKEAMTVAVLNGFVLAMVLYPDILKELQTELDAVVGRSRLPSFDDMDHLPYLDAVIRELHRWGGAKTLAIPHKLMQDDIYNDYLLPGGAIVVANVYAMLRACDRPDEFIPERFTNSHYLRGDVPEDPRELVFGFGRRRCPGEHLANRSIYIAIAYVAALFNIAPLKDVNGKLCPPKVEFVTGGPVRHPKPFQCDITLQADRKHLLERTL